MCPRGDFMLNFQPVNSIINTLSVNEDNVMFAGGDDGSATFYDWKTGHQFENSESVVQPGSLQAEAGILTSTFDRTGLRLITGHIDVSVCTIFPKHQLTFCLQKTIRVWKEDEDATEETHPLDWKPTLGRQKF